jgi:hypothetical protein
MDSEIKKIIEDTHTLAKENHRLLKSMHRIQLWSMVGKFVIWIIVLLLPIYLYQEYLAPVIGTLISGGTTSTSPGIFGLPSGVDLQNLLDSYRL